MTEVNHLSLALLAFCAASAGAVVGVFAAGLWAHGRMGRRRRKGNVLHGWRPPLFDWTPGGES